MQEVAEIAKEAARPDVLGSLGLDWKLFLAQLLNFGIVLLVLWKWAFTPLVNALDKRRKAIETGLEDARSAAAARTNAERDAETAIGAARREAQRVIEAAQAAADKVRAEALDRTRADVAAVVAEGRALLAREKDLMVAEAKEEVADLAVAVAAKAIGSAMDEKTQRASLDAAVKRILA